MEYVNLGNSGLKVSKICLGAMGFGDVKAGWTHQWVVDQNQTDEIVKLALENGINFFDTANIYSYGTSEIFLGNALKKYAKREDVVIATKCFFGDGNKDVNNVGLSRKAIFSQVEKSLERLQTDYIDLLIIHRWDYNTPIEETMKALNDLIVSGKVRYIGASAMYCWQFQKAQYVSEKYNYSKFISMQNHYNLIYREDERELLKFCEDSSVSSTPYSPLASGRLTRDLENVSKRSETDHIQKAKYDKTSEIDQEIIKRTHELSEKYQVSRANIALAWLLSKDVVTAPIIGATKPGHITDALKALDVVLTKEDIEYLEEAYIPHEVVGAL